MLSATFRLVAPCLQPCTALRGLTCRQLVTSGGRGRARFSRKRDAGPPGPPSRWNRIGHATVFTLVGSGSILTGCVVWQYEGLRASIVRARERGQAAGWWEFKPAHRQLTTVAAWLGYMWGTFQPGWRRDLYDWWHSQSEGQRLFWPICLINVCVFGALRTRALQPAMMRFFVSDPTARSFRAAMLLSAFSHVEIWHLAINMFVLHSFSTSAVAMLGREQFLGVYLSGALFSSLASYAHKMALGMGGASLGASGAIFAVLGYVCTEQPDSRLMIVFLPMFTFSAGVALKAVMLLDTVGVALRWRLFDHAAHLGGAVLGVLWSLYGQDQIWNRREPVLRAWHRLREGSHQP